jgi:hypothetical protein
MKARIDSRFATAAETAKVLGVPRARLKKLVRFADSLLHQRNGSSLSYATAEKARAPKLKASKKSQSGLKRHARAKVAKALR